MTKSTTRVAADLQTFTQTEITAKDVVAKAGRKNLLINGAMQVSQRGTSGTSGFTVDRWFSWGNITSWSQTGSQNDVLQYVTQANTGVAQRVESKGGGFYSGNTYTLSFKVNPSVADIEVGVTYRNSNSYLSSILSTSSYSSQVTAGVYSTVEITFTLPTNADPITYDKHNLQVYIGSSVVNTINLKDVQLELGSVATDFEHRSYGEELALCQRYYQKSRAATPNQNTFGGHQIAVIAGQEPQAVIRLVPEMRSAPTVVLYSSYGPGANSQWYGAAFNTGFSTHARAFGGDSIAFIIDNTDIHAPASGWCEIGWTAEAEL